LKGKYRDLAVWGRGEPLGNPEEAEERSVDVEYEPPREYSVETASCTGVKGRCADDDPDLSLCTTSGPGE